MPTRAERRNLERQERNARARSVIVEDPRPRRAGTKTQLEILYGRGAITLQQKNAGERLYRDYHLSGAEPRVTANLEPSLGGRSAGVVDMQADAYERYQRAVQAVGPILSPVLVHVVLLDGSAGDWALSVGLKRGRGPARLEVALEILIQHYQNREIAL